MVKVFVNNFLGDSPIWYKGTILLFLLINPLVFYLFSPFVAGWMLLIEFIFTLSLALKCYPIPPGGLLALEAVLIGLTTPEGIYAEVASNLPTILLLIFMVAGIYYIKDVVFLIFTKVFISIKSKAALSFTFCLLSASLSAFLDAMTLMAILIAVCFNFFAIYHRVANTMGEREKDPTKIQSEEFEEFKGFLRNLIMHGAVGTALGGTMTLVGEPQNLMIGTAMNWSFIDFFKNCAVISLPVALVGLLLCPLLEICKVPGFGHQLPERAKQLILSDYEKKARQITRQSKYLYFTQGTVALLLVLSLAMHVAEIGLIGISLIIVLSTFTGATKEHDFAEAFSNAMPFVTLIIVFFAILAVVHDQNLVKPLASWVFSFEGKMQLLALYFVNGLLSLVSDSVFIASVFMKEVSTAYEMGHFSFEWYEKLAVIVNMGTNIPAVATPNGQAAFLFLLTSSLAPVLHLSYMKMVKLALPYTLVMTATGAICVYFFL